MKTIMIMFDSLNLRMLPPYGCEKVIAPNFERLAEKGVTFENFYAGSLPCMPARRELHTGRYNFLHRSWGPLEPFDLSLPEILKENNVYSHLVTDHYHYLEDGGATYHNRYSSFEFIRGQEGDPYIGQVKDPDFPTCDYPNFGYHDTFYRRDLIHRQSIQSFEEHTQAKVFKGGLDFIKRNMNEDNWFLQIEEFDPHEPFYADDRFREMYPHEYEGNHFDWPTYRRVIEPDDVVTHCRYEYKSLVSMCDYHLGKVLDIMDEYHMWEDTMLIVNTDHGFLLGEKNWWGKCVQPFYNEIAHTPFFIYDPRTGIHHERRKSLAQTIDIMPTILEFFEIDIPDAVEGKPLVSTIKEDTPIREYALFGIHGGHVNMTDGRYVYMRANATKDNQPLFEYTLMPTRMRGFFSKEDLLTTRIEKENTFSFCDVKTMKINTKTKINPASFGTMLFDLQKDPLQEHPLTDSIIEKNMIDKLIEKLKECEAPKEQYIRLGLNNYQ